jgi:hypothetical protein
LSLRDPAGAEHTAGPPNRLPPRPLLTFLRQDIQDIARSEYNSAMNETTKSGSGFRQSARRCLSSLSAAAMILESALLAVLVFGDIGFDHPGRFGLDFNAILTETANSPITME